MKYQCHIHPKIKQIILKILLSHFPDFSEQCAGFDVPLNTQHVLVFFQRKTFPSCSGNNQIHNFQPKYATTKNIQKIIPNTSKLTGPKKNKIKKILKKLTSNS